MNDIDFARDNAGKEYAYRGYKVKVVGYDCSGTGDCVIISGYPSGWSWEYTSPTDIILAPAKQLLQESARLFYVNMDDLKEIEK